jgi:biotin operon repressor
MATETQAIRKSGLKLKSSSGWFAAGASFQRALTLLSDGAFKLFAYISLEADRGTGRFEASQTDLARVLQKSRRVIGRYIAELERPGICTVSSARNQYGRNIFKILDDYWPYHRPTIAEETKRNEEDAYVAAVRDRFLATGCTRGKFGIGDEMSAKAMKEHGVSLELLQEALLLGACRKYDSWLNGGSPEPIGSLAYFGALVSEVRDHPLPPGYCEYLHTKVAQLARMWEETKAAALRAKNGAYPPIDK